MRRGTPAIEPMLQALRAQLEVFGAYSARVDDLIAALVAADFTAVQGAVAAQTAVLGQVETAERRRQAAEAAIIQALTGRLPAPGVPRGVLTISALLKRLPPQDAAALSGLRRDLLTALQGLQARQRQAAVLIRAAQTVLQRTAAAVGVAGHGYGPHGEQAMIQQVGRGRQGRWA
ncbi:MAG: flagellar export chaperone FlgN [Chloroflexota bacterium]